MAAGSTYTPIATTTLGTTQNSVSFNSFSGYTDLVLVTNIVWSNTTNLFINFNSDTNTNYSNTLIVGNGTTTTSALQSAQTRIAAGYNGTASGNRVVHTISLINYANTSTFKSAIIRVANPNTDVIAQVGLYRSTSAITSIQLEPQIQPFSAGSVFTLYGIQAA